MPLLLYYTIGIPSKRIEKGEPLKCKHEKCYTSDL